MDSAMLKQDPISGNLGIIESEHGAIHFGAHFTLSKLTTTSSYLSLAYTTPAASTGKRLHFVWAANADKAASVVFSEAASVSGGTALTAANNNRESALTDPGTWVADPVFTSAGTVLETHVIGTTGTGATRPGGGATARNEWYLKYNTVYLIRVAATLATTITEITVPYYYRTEPS